MFKVFRFLPKAKLQLKLSLMKSTKLRASLVSDYFFNSRRAWSFNAPNSKNYADDESTSLSDEYVYSAFCSVASLDTKIYNKFRSCNQYQQILEHVSRDLGQEYLDMFIASDKFDLNLLELVSDDIGSPFRYTYPRVGRVSPTQLRYAKVLSDLVTLFGGLDKFSVIEVGIGYGGQASQICQSFNLAKYWLVDLPSVLNLAKRYIQERVSDAPILLINGDNMVPNKFDLFISNYAFSELKREIQEQYFRDYIKYSKRGYVIYNDITPHAWGSMSANEFVTRVPGAEIFDEIPKTGEKNVLIVWGHVNSL